MDIVILSLIRHDAPISSTTLALAKVLCQHHRVFYLDHPRTMKDVRAEGGMQAFKQQWKERNQGVLHPREVKVGNSSFTAFRPWMTWPNNFLPAGPLYNLFGDWNNHRMADFLRTLVKKYQLKDYLFINAMDPFFLAEIPADIRPKYHVYYSLDNISEVDYTAKHGSRLEAEQVKKANFVLATSTMLQEKMQQWTKEVHLLPNAVDYAHFHQATRADLPIAKELKDLKEPLIGYVGSLEYRVDADIMEAVLQSHPDKRLVAIGPVMKEHFPIDRLDRYPNFLYLGPRKFDELPSYIKAFSCGIIPFQKTGVTRSIYPLKVNEYLAAGLPVVATAFSPDIMSFQDVIYLADDAKVFAQAIDLAVDSYQNQSPEPRYQKALANTWEVRVERLWEILAARTKA